MQFHGLQSGDLGYLSGKTPADHLLPAKFKPVVREAAARIIKYIYFR
jgi:hypothetical protein